MSARRELARSEEANQKLQRDVKEVRAAVCARIRLVYSAISSQSSVFSPLAVWLPGERNVLRDLACILLLLCDVAVRGCRWQDERL